MSVKSISYHEIQDRLLDGQELVFFDVRPTNRLYLCRFGGIHVPFEELQPGSSKMLTRITPHVDKVVVLVCSNYPSGRVEKARNRLQKLGFSDMYELQDGYVKGWTKHTKDYMPI
jgi:rhodanese-related sulfurtransferase